LFKCGASIQAGLKKRDYSLRFASDYLAFCDE
jgi:hypothetical protein